MVAFEARRAAAVAPKARPGYVDLFLACKTDGCTDLADSRDGEATAR